MTSSSTLADDVELELECPVCLDPFQPPVFQCNNGHLVCKTCLTRCPICPVCREQMPRKKIRNLVFDNILKRRATINAGVPCTLQSAGCLVLVRGNEVENHKLDCAYVKRELCLQLGLKCTAEFSSSNMSEIITHFIFDHSFDGSFGNSEDAPSSGPGPGPGRGPGATIDANIKISSKFQLTQNCRKSELSGYLMQESSMRPNFISFDDKIFFVKKIVSTTKKFQLFWVCIDASLKTAEEYFAVFELFSGYDYEEFSAPTFEFKQQNIHLLSHQFTNSESGTSHLFCKVPFSAIEACGSLDTDRPGAPQHLSWKLNIRICNKLGFTATAQPNSISRSLSVPSSSSLEIPAEVTNPVSTSQSPLYGAGAVPLANESNSRSQSTSADRRRGGSAVAIRGAASHSRGRGQQFRGSSRSSQNPRTNFDSVLSNDVLNVSSLNDLSQQLTHMRSILTSNQNFMNLTSSMFPFPAAPARGRGRGPAQRSSSASAHLGGWAPPAPLQNRVDNIEEFDETESITDDDTDTDSSEFEYEVFHA